jgi:hypothetical protein
MDRAWPPWPWCCPPTTTTDLREPRPARPADSGQASILLVAVLGVAVLLALLVARVGSVAADRAAARTAADAAALAGVRDGLAGVNEAAVRNGAIVLDVRIDAGGVEVTVQHGEATASARASGT